ncbi:MAG TPA: hypothetical protein EYP68_06650 [Candidatus Korarchaeota archaeon]|nr:hypothetical protein [Candidatus Korarchaeota archaeon]
MEIRISKIIALITIISILLSSIPILGTAVSATPDPVLPFPDYHTDPLNGIFYPRLGTPAFVIYNGEMDICAKKELIGSELKVYLRSLFTEGYEYALEVVATEDVGSGMLKITAKIPEGIPEGLFNLTVRSGTSELTEPNAVYVFGSKFPEKLNVIHITDNHYGVRRIAKLLKNRELFRQLIALVNGLRPDIMVHTGDLIDGIARADEEDPFRAVYQDLVRLRVPLIVVQGNNDNTAIEKGSYFWEKYIGPLYSVVEFGNYSFFLLDADTGRIQPEQISWLEKRIELYKDLQVKVLMMHYPYHTEELGYFHKERGFVSVVPNITKWLESYKFSLVLMGHWHVDNITRPPQVPTLSIVSNAGQFDDADDYGHYRPITIWADGSVDFINPAPSIATLSIKYLQRYDGSATGVSLIVTNKGASEVNLILPAILSKYQENPSIENAEILRSYNHKGKGIYELGVSVSPGEELLVKIYVEEDTTAPSITVEPEVKEETITLWYEALDEGLGVKDVKLYYSVDNKTWMEIIPEFEAGYPLYKFQAKAGTMYYKVLAEDMAGNKAEFYGTIEVPSLKPTETPTPTTAPPKPPAAKVPISYIGLAIVGIIVVVAAVLLKRR